MQSRVYFIIFGMFLVQKFYGLNSVYANGTTSLQFSNDQGKYGVMDETIGGYKNYWPERQGNKDDLYEAENPINSESSAEINNTLNIGEAPTVITRNGDQEIIDKDPLKYKTRYNMEDKEQRVGVSELPNRKGSQSAVNNSNGNESDHQESESATSKEKIGKSELRPIGYTEHTIQGSTDSNHRLIPPAQSDLTNGKDNFLTLHRYGSGESQEGGSNHTAIITESETYEEPAKEGREEAIERANLDHETAGQFSKGDQAPQIVYDFQDSLACGSVSQNDSKTIDESDQESSSCVPDFQSLNVTLSQSRTQNTAGVMGPQGIRETLHQIEKTVSSLPKKLPQHFGCGPTIVLPSPTSDRNILTDKSHCPSGYYGLWGKEHDCSKFIDCAPVEDFEAINLIEFCRRKPSGTYGHPSDSSKYIMCDNERPFEFNCPEGTLFHKVHLVCVHQNQIEDEREGYAKNGIQCPTGISGLFAYPFNRRQYLHCSNNRTVVEICPRGTFFSASKSVCDYLSDIGKETITALEHLREEYRLLTCPTVNRRSYLYPFDASKYLRCSQYQIFQILSCGHRQFFSISQGKCLTKENIPFYDRVPWLGEIQPLYSHTCTAMYSPIKCPVTVSGIFPHPFKNTQYIKCFDGSLLIKSCRQGHMFSISKNYCLKIEHLKPHDTSVPRKLSDTQTSTDEEANEQGHDEPINSGILKCPYGDGMDTFIYPFLNTRYIKCVNGVLSVQTCPADEVYMIREKKCMLARDIDIAGVHFVKGVERELKMISDDNTYGVICGPQSDGNYSHPEDLRKFIICRNRVLTIELCPDKKIFDMNLMKCS